MNELLEFVCDESRIRKFAQDVLSILHGGDGSDLAAVFANCVDEDDNNSIDALKILAA